MDMDMVTLTSISLIKLFSSFVFNSDKRTLRKGLPFGLLLG